MDPTNARLILIKSQEVKFKKNSPPPLSSNPFETKKPSREAQDPRLLNKYLIDSKPSFVVNIENLTCTSVQPNNTSSSPQVMEPKANREAISNAGSLRHSETNSFGIIAFGKRINKHIDLFNQAFDLKS